MLKKNVFPSLRRRSGCAIKKNDKVASQLFLDGAATPPLLLCGFAQKVGNGHAARSEICNRQSSGTQQRCAISSAIALANCTWLLDIGDRRMRIGDVQKAASDFLCKAECREAAYQS